MSNQQLLREVVCENSVSKKWTNAKAEWDLLYIYNQPHSNCACQHGITENCVIENRNNGNRLIVGNVCINHFEEKRLEVDASAHTSLNRLANGMGHIANAALVEIAVRTNVLSEAEAASYTRLTTGRGSRNRFTDGHEHYNASAVATRDKINRLICLGFADSRPLCHCGNPAKPRQNSQTGNCFYSCYDGRYGPTGWTARCAFSKNVA